MGEYDQISKVKEEEFKYTVYSIEYTNIQGKRAKAKVSAKSAEQALSMLENLLEKAGYWNSSIKNLQSVATKTDAGSCDFWVELK